MVYIDRNTFQCYATQNAEATRIPDEEPLFNGKCQTFIEGYCCVPYGYTLILPDGTATPGRQVFPWTDISELEEAQREYERQLLAEYESALAEIEAALGV